MCQKARWPANDDELQRFVCAFNDGSLPRDYWSHSGHIAIAIHYLTQFAPQKALALIREQIRVYNERKGVKNTPSGGYHETLTVFWTGLLANFVATQPTYNPIVSTTAAAVEHFGHLATLPRFLYTFDVVTHPEARSKWIPPDIWDGQLLR